MPLCGWGRTFDHGSSVDRRPPPRHGHRCPSAGRSTPHLAQPHPECRARATKPDHRSPEADVRSIPIVDWDACECQRHNVPRCEVPRGLVEELARGRSGRRHSCGGSANAVASFDTRGIYCESWTSFRHAPVVTLRRPELTLHISRRCARWALSRSALRAGAATSCGCSDATTTTPCSSGPKGARHRC